MSDSIYKSHTHGPIPLSFTGKRLMQNLREEIAKAISEGKWHEQISYARGELAKYMSELEKRPAPARATTATEVNMRQQAEANRPGPSKYLTNPFDWSTQWMEYVRKDIDCEANKAMYDALLYGTGRVKVNDARKVEHVPFQSYFGDSKITGNRATMMILDDPQNEQELDMSKKAVATRRKAAKVQAAKAAKFMPVGIRFLHGTNLAQICTYKAKRAAKLTLGQEVVVRNSRGTNVGVVVTLDDVIPHGWVLDTLVELTHKVAAL